MFNETGYLGVLIIGMTNHITGNIFITLLTIFALLFMFFLALKLPMELVATILVPILILFMAEAGGDWKAITSIIMLYLALMFGRWFFK